MSNEDFQSLLLTGFATHLGVLSFAILKHLLNLYIPNWRTSGSRVLIDFTSRYKEDSLAMSRYSKQHGLSKDKAGSGSTDSTNNDTKTFAERLGASAATLTRQALLQPSGAAMAQTMGSLSMNTEKGESSSSSAASEESFSNTNTFRSRPSPEMATGFGIEFSQEPTDTHRRNLTDSAPFNLGAPDLPMLGISSSTAFDDGPLTLKQTESEVNIQKNSPQSGQAQQGFEISPIISHDDEVPSSASYSPIESTRGALDKGSRSLIDSMDGAAVVDLLSTPSLSVNDEIEDQALTSAGMPDMYRQSKYSETGQREVSPGRNDTGTERQLIPDFGLTGIDLKSITQAMPRAVDQAHNPELQPWLEILNSYQDEVWGGMLPLVRQAREELAMASDNKNPLVDKRAVRRLRMLLSHLAHPQNT